MDMYGHTTTDLFRIDDLLDFSNDDLFSSSAAAVDYSGHNPPPMDTSFSSTAASAVHRDCPYPVSSGDFTADDLYVPSDDVAELEWLSQFVDDSFADFTTTEFAGAVNFRPDPSSHCRSRSKRTRAAAGTGAAWISPPTSEKVLPATASGRFKSNGGRKKEGSPAPSGDRSPAERMITSGPRRCSHCSSEKTPQWRTGPMGPKTLCNACGVRYKSGRLVPEYRPAASPTFVLTQHSNSHRKVLELRRQKEILRQEQQQQVEQLYHHHHPPPHRHHHDFEVC